MVKKSKRGWHFKKSFIAFCAVFTAVIVIIITSCIAHSVKKKKQDAVNQPNGIVNEVVTNKKNNNKNSNKNKGDKDKNPSVSDPTGIVPASTSAAVGTTAPITVAPVTNPDDKVIYLTFDDGPSKNTDRILKVLDDYGIKATFFVIHTYDGCESQIRDIYQKGHAIGLHSYTHDFSIYESESSYFDDLNKISDLVYTATGIRSNLVRFPGGTSNTISRNYCDGIMTQLSQSVPSRGFRYFDWDWDSTDASGNNRTSDEIYENAIKGAQADDHNIILLMHDAPAKTTTADALPRIIQYYKDCGYRFDVLSDSSYTYQHNPNN